MGNQFDNVKAEQRQADPSYIVMWGGSGPEATAQCSGPESAAEISRRWNMFPKLVKAIKELVDDSFYNKHSVPNARALLLEVKE